MVIEPAALHLRFRDDAATSGPCEPPDVAAFLRAPPASARPPHDEELGVLPGARPADPSGPLVIFLQPLEFGIPAPGHDDRVPDLADWSVRPTKFGWIASVSPPTRGAGLRRATQVVAGCLALTLPIPTIALADAPAGAKPAAEAPASPPATAKPGKASGKASKPTSGKAPEPAPAPVTPTPEPVVPPADPEPLAVPETVAPPEPTPAVPPPPPPRVQDRVLADAAWEGIDGFVVVVELKGGKSLKGRVGAVQPDTFTLIESTEGQILVIPKSGVSSLRAYVPPPLPTQTGSGLIAGGSVLTGLGVPVFLTGVVFVAICPSCTYIHIPMLVVGGGALGGGIPMISRGIKRRNEFQAAVEERRITPLVQRTPFHGWTGGIQFRF